MAYHCNRGGHDYRRIPKAQFEATVEEFVHRIKIAPVHTARLLEIFAEEWNSRQESYYRNLDFKREQLGETKAQIRNIVNNMHFMHSDTALEYIEGDLDQLETEKRQLEEDIRQAEQNIPPSAAEVMSKARRYIEHVDALLAGGNSVLAKERLFSVIFDSLPDYSQLVEATMDGHSHGRINELFMVN